MSALDTQVGGDHYKKLGNYQPWEVLSKWMTGEELKGAMKKEAISYLAREQDKGGREDIKKAAHTIQLYLELTEAKPEIKTSGHVEITLPKAGDGTCFVIKAKAGKWEVVNESAIARTAREDERN